MLFSVWLILNGKITLEICLFGVAVCSVIYFAACRVTGFSVKKDGFFIRRIPYGIAYAAVLFWEIVKANCAVVRVILSGRKPDPAIVVFSVPLQTEWAKVLLANAITLTPGTITVSVDFCFPSEKDGKIAALCLFLFETCLKGLLLWRRLTLLILCCWFAFLFFLAAELSPRLSVR